MTQDIFITPLETPLKSWVAAFAKASVMRALPASLNVAEGTVFWLHINPEQRAWIQETTADILRRYPSARVAVLANIPNNEEALFALGLGALAYGHAYVSEKTLKEMRTVMLNGGVWIGNDLLQALIHASVSAIQSTSSAQDNVLQALTKREREVALQAAKGLSNKEIARLLSITERTVKAHLSSVFETLGVKDRLYLALVLNQHAHAEQSLVQAVAPTVATKDISKKKALASPDAPVRDKGTEGQYTSYTYSV